MMTAELGMFRPAQDITEQAVCESVNTEEPSVKPKNTAIKRVPVTNMHRAKAHPPTPKAIHFEIIKHTDFLNVDSFLVSDLHIETYKMYRHIITTPFQLQKAKRCFIDGTLKVRIKVFRGHKEGLNSGQFFQNDTKVLTSSHDSSAKIWDFHTGEALHSYEDGSEAPIAEAAVSNNGTRIVCAGWNKKVTSWDIETGTLLWSGDHDGIVMCCRVSGDGKMAVSGSDYDNALKIWDINSGELIHSIPGLHSSTITSCIFAPKDDKIITTSMDRSTKFVDLKTLKTTIKLEGHINVISSSSISNDERKFATASWDKTIQLWDVATGGYRSHGPSTLAGGHDGCVSCCHFSSDGLMLASGAYDNCVVVWDADNSVQKLKLQGHGDWVQDVSFSSDDKWLMSCSKDKTLRFWNLEERDKIPVVLENKRSIGLKIITCSKCAKPFSMAQVENFRENTLCVFCRLQNPAKPSLSFIPETET